MLPLRTLLVLSLTSVPTVADAQLGLGRSLSKGNPKTLKFEMALLKGINGLRQKKKQAPLQMDEKLRALMRQQSELGARGDPAAKTFDARIKSQRLAPHGFRVQYAFGTNVKKALINLQQSPGAEAALYAEFARIGVGAFWVPDDKPYFQVGVIVATEPDPMAGKAGLARTQTDPIMKRASETITTVCFNPELQKNPNLRGNLVFQLIIGDKGQIDSARLLSGTETESFNSCALRVVKQLTFPAPYKGKPVTLNHPMRFSPPQGDTQIGRLTPAQIARVFRMTQHNFERCYDARVAEKPKLEGKLELALTVRADGSLKEVSVAKDSLRDAALAKCVLGYVEKLAFPPPEFGGEAQVSFPVSFRPRSRAR